MRWFFFLKKTFLKNDQFLENIYEKTKERKIYDYQIQDG